MTENAIKTGITAGILLSLASLLPVFSLVLPLQVAGWESPIANPVLRVLALVISVGLAVSTLSLFGPVAALRARVHSLTAGVYVGALAGLIVGVIYFATIVSPYNAVAAISRLTEMYHPTPSHLWPSEMALAGYASAMVGGISVLGAATLAVAIPIGAIGGGVTGFIQRRVPAQQQPTLFDMVDRKEDLRRWFRDGSEQPTRAGLAVGGLVGIMLGFLALRGFYVGFASDNPRLAELLRDRLPDVIVTNALPAFAPLLILSMLLMGAVIVGLIKNPPNRYAARVGAVVLGTNVMFVPLLVSELHVFYFNLGFMPYYIFQFNREVLAGIERVDTAMVDVIGMTINSMLLSDTATLMLAVYLMPWLLFIALITFWSLVGLVSGLFYSGVIPMAMNTPVDIATVVTDKLKAAPDAALPTIYGLFTRYRNAYDILAHIATNAQFHAPDLARLTAALHTMGTSASAETHARMVSAVREVVERHPDWRWHGEIDTIYTSLDHVMQARTIEQILEIPPPREPETKSLPAIMVRAVQVLKRAVMELHKVNRVEDLSSQLIFLENALDTLNSAERFLQQEMVGRMLEGTTTPPEQPALSSAVAHWQTVLLAEIKRLKGRADVRLALVNRQCPHTAQVMFAVRVENQGLNVAQALQIRLLPGPDYSIVNGAEHEIEILPPGETRELTMAIEPRPDVPRVRAEWEIRYDDAVDDSRVQRFADVIEFIRPEKPFERIFPIPYVTGTPLKTDNVFVGRDDVFSFIRENLVGAHQNNVVILHGQRRTGKTSVLYRLARVLEDTHHGVLIDMQGKPARGAADFLFSIADDIVFSLEEAGIELDVPQRSDFEEAPEFFFRNRFLRGLRTQLNGKNLLLMFDEFEELQQRVTDGHLQPDIFQFLRNLMQHEDHVDFVFSGTHKLEELGAEYWSVLFNTAVYMPITFLGNGEVRRLIHEPVAQYHIEYDPLAESRIVQVTAGHPYFTQLVLHEMLVYHNETERSYVTVADVDAVLERIVERGEAHFKYIWAEACEDERELMLALAELMIGKEAATVTDITHLLIARGCSSDDNWKAAFAALEGRDIFTRRDARSPLYRYKVELVRLWVQRTRPPL